MDATGAGTVPLQDLGTNAYPTTLAVFPYSLEKDDAGAFVGPNTEKYWTRWASMSYRRSRLSWHWPSFFLGPIWLGYRRMHAEAFVVTACISPCQFFLCSWQKILMRPCLPRFFSLS